MIIHAGTRILAEISADEAVASVVKLDPFLYPVTRLLAVRDARKCALVVAFATPGMPEKLVLMLKKALPELVCFGSIYDDPLGELLAKPMMALALEVLVTLQADRWPLSRTYCGLPTVGLKVVSITTVELPSVPVKPRSTVKDIAPTLVAV